MVQGTGVSEATLMDAIHAAAQAAGQAIEAQKALVSQTGNSKVPMPMRGLPDPAALTRIAAVSQPQIEGALGDDALGCSQRSRLLEAAKAEAMESLRSVGAVRSEASSVPPTPAPPTKKLVQQHAAAASACASCLQMKWSLSGNDLLKEDSPLLSIASSKLPVGCPDCQAVLPDSIACVCGV